MPTPYRTAMVNEWLNTRIVYERAKRAQSHSTDRATWRYALYGPPLNQSGPSFVKGAGRGDF